MRPIFSVRADLTPDLAIYSYAKERISGALRQQYRHQTTAFQLCLTQWNTANPRLCDRNFYIRLVTF
ncbi:MAG: hypothetical protein F6K24_12015 [Okeania sp. SIO2D1]|nr:hypothetical protein [Okeania sp. SIO2D1]